MKRIIRTKEDRRLMAHKIAHLTSTPIMEVIIQEHKENKTIDQRNFWHKLLGIISDETGYSKMEVKNMVKRIHLGTKEVTIGGVTKEVTEDSESLSRKKYSELIEATYQLAAEAEILLPPPERNYE